MWISGWSIDEFGHLQGTDLDGLTEGVNVVLGPNESGKTTMVHFLRWVLFGFPHGRTLAVQKYRRGSAIIGGRVRVVHDCRTISVQRHFGDDRPGLSGTDGSALAHMAWSDVVGTAGRELFETVFAITTDELNSFAELNTDEVREHVYAAGMVGSGPSAREALEKLDNVRSALLKQRSGRIRDLHRDLDGRTEELHLAIAVADGLGSRRQNLERLRAVVDECDRRRRRCDTDRAHLGDLIASWPSWSEATALHEELARMPEAPQLPPDPLGRLESLIGSLATATGQLTEAEDALRASIDQSRTVERGAAVPMLLAVSVLCLIAAGISMVVGAPLPAVAFVVVTAVAAWLALALHRHRTAVPTGAPNPGLALQSLLAGVDAKNAEEFRAVAAREDARDRITDRLAQIDFELSGRFGLDEAVRSARVELATGDPESWKREVTAIGSRQKEELTTYELALGEYRTEMAAIAEVESSTDVAGLSLRVEALRSELREAIDDWTVATLAHKAIDDTLRRFETERQPQVVLSAAESFNRITDGRYTNLIPEQGALTVLDPRGSRLDSSQLSRGATEQLYLAMRFALARQHARTTSLPLVLDDVLVNADPPRKRHLARELHVVATDLQVLLFTCHPETAELLAEVGCSTGRGPTNIVEMPR